MPPHLHPRSAATSTLFAGTLVASFVVIAVPHIWPCPRPRKAYNDSEIIFDDQGKPIKRLRRVKKGSEQIPENFTAMPSQGRKGNSMEDEAKILYQLQAEAQALEEASARRPCPVPKPKGVVGRLLGFEEQNEKP